MNAGFVGLVVNAAVTLLASAVVSGRPRSTQAQLERRVA
jgi:hypothetical protein